MSEKIINNITSKINNHFSKKYPLDFPKIGLNSDDLSLLVDKILTRGGVSISSLSKDEIRDKIENLIQILENKIKTHLELENKKMTREYQNLQYDKPNNYYNTNKGYEQDTTFKYEENLKKSIQNLEDKQTEIKYDMEKHSNFSIKDRYYPEEMNYEKKTTKKVQIKINSKDRKVYTYSSPSNITFSFSKKTPLLIPIVPKNISNEVLVLDTELDSGLDTELDSGLDTELDSGLDTELDSGLDTELDKTIELDKNNLGFIDKIKYNKSIHELEINIDKLIGNSIIPINLNQVIALKILNVILFDKYMVSKRPIPYLLLQIPELTKEITSMDNYQILGGDNNILNSIMCLDDYRVMNGYRYYTNMEFGGIRFETPRNIDKLTFQLLTPTGEEVKMSSQMENTPETVVQYSLELEVEV
jgi:hypothetical protein